ncbi:unnamed protein product [Didymodactylos carnosus]|uniref:carnosine N-methyltransferase n=1 Tax=Didymodactylos carnosus TaxID=1234261 RepID=A0A814NHK0_9BILA|nr:unnamed protein product [Didymodactylos carnosus]CAF1093020.1 unnamed protein product [Didymodactylos carnosus]CAF3762914.1 unnamed protein product [Didymodactylos carnosus]CAF3858410.1 unnamed protein product [Didymodactylos carnosus]
MSIDKRNNEDDIEDRQNMVEKHHCNSSHNSNAIDSYDVDDADEQKHFQKVVNAFLYYRSYARNRIRRSFHYYGQLSDAHKQLLPKFESHLALILKRIDKNYNVLKNILQGCDHLFENQNRSFDLPSSTASNDELNMSDQDEVNPPAGVLSMDMDKIKTTLKQFVRDWTEEGKEERNSCYQPIIDEIVARLPLQKEPNEFCNDVSYIQILVPGAGLGRLSWELARLGYACQGNEVSMYMLIASHYVLNRCQQVNATTIYPWVLQFCNNYSNEDQLRAARFPDVDTSSLPQNARFSMSAGDFLHVYNEPGPLLYHFEDMVGEMSIEISYVDLRSVILKYGFQILTENYPIRTGYIKNARSMLHYEYDCVFFVAYKPTN